MGGYATRLTRPVEIVEAAYSLDGTLDQWLDRIVRVAADDLDAGLGVFGFVSKITPDALPIVSPIASRGVSRDVLASLPFNNATPPPGVARYIGSQVIIFDSVTAAFGGPSGQMARDTRTRVSAADVIGALAQDGEDHVLQLIALSRSPVQIHPHTKMAWRKILLHLGTALRLRRRLGALPAPTAMLTPGGRVEHAEADAKASSARAALVTAVRNIERARTRSIRRRPDEALALWRGLVSGRWSLVDHFESDGRRYLAAHENARSSSDPRALSRLERDSLHYYVGGASTEEIAFAFGRSPTTIGTALSAIARRLGFPSRAALRRVSDATFTRLAVGLDEHERVDVLVIGDVRVDEGWRAVLGDAPLEVAMLAARGLSDGEIATRRGRSVRTVSNQLRAVYRRADVRSRSGLIDVLTRPPVRRGGPSGPPR